VDGVRLRLLKGTGVRLRLLWLLGITEVAKAQDGEIRTLLKKIVPELVPNG